MSKNKIIGIAISILGLVLSLVFMFCLQKGLTATFWITLAFVCVAFISALVFQLIEWNGKNTADEQFLYLPAITVSFVYVVVQFPICIVFALGSEVIPYKVAILVNAVVLVSAWGAALSSLAGNDHIKKVNSRQKDHHTEL